LGYVKINFMPPKLREIIEKVLDAGDMDQAQLALKLYGSEKKQGKISVMMSASDGSGWEKHWQVCARLVPLAISLGVLTDRDLLDLTQHGAKQHGPKKDHDRSKASRAKASSG
jgi:hypothetical protein